MKKQGSLSRSEPYLYKRKKMLKYQASVNEIRPGEPAAEPFGVPLQSDDGQAGVNDSFDNAVIRLLDGGNFTGAQKDSLMVCAVDDKVRAV